MSIIFPVNYEYLNNASTVTIKDSFNFHIPNTTNATTSGTGAAIIGGGVYIGGNLVVAGNISTLNGSVYGYTGPTGTQGTSGPTGTTGPTGPDGYGSFLTWTAGNAANAGQLDGWGGT